MAASKDLFLIKEYSEDILLEDAFKPAKKARLNIYRLAELADYIDANGFLEEGNWGYLLQMKSKLDERYEALDTQLSYHLYDEEFTFGEINYVSFDSDGEDLQTLIQWIKDFYKINADLEKYIIRFLEKIIRSIEDDITRISGQINDSSSFLEIEYNYTLKNTYKLNNLSTDIDKIVTYIIISKDPKQKRELDKIELEDKFFKVRDQEFRIKMLYEKISDLEKLYLESTKIYNNLNSIEESKKVQKKQNTINNWLFILAILSLASSIIQIVQK